MKVANINAQRKVEYMEEFKGSNTFSEWRDGVYKVYSYGYHFPMYAYKDGKWYRNIDKYSVSTSRHQSQLCPTVVEFVDLDTDEMIKL